MQSRYTIVSSNNICQLKSEETDKFYTKYVLCTFTLTLIPISKNRTEQRQNFNLSTLVSRTLAMSAARVNICMSAC